MKTKAFILFGVVVLIALVIVIVPKSPDKDGYGSEEKALLAGINANLEKNNIATTDELNFTPLYKYQYMNDTYYINRFEAKGEGPLTYSENVYVIRVYQNDNKYYYEAESADFAVKQITDKGETFTPVWTIPIENRNLAFIVGIVPDPQNTQILADKTVPVDENGFFVYVFEGTGKAPQVTIMNGTYTIS